MNNLELLKELIDNAGDFIVILDKDFHPVYANQIVYESLEVSPESLFKHGLQYFVHPDDMRVVKEFRSQLLSHPNDSFVEKVRYISKSGKVLHFETNCVFKDELNCTIAINRNLKNIIGHESIYGDAKKLAKIGAWEYSVETNELSWDDVVYDIYELNKKTDINIERMKQFFLPESLETFNKNFISLIDNSTPMDLELSFISGRFKPSTARFIGKAIPGKVTKIVGTIQDLSDLRRFERKSEDYKEAVDKSSIVSITDRDGIISEVNDKFCEISKYSRKELTGMSFNIINSGFHRKEFWKDLWDTITAGDVWSGEIKNRTKDGQHFWVNTTIIPFKNSSGNIYQYLSIQTDITANKKMTEELMVSEKLSSIGEISAQILHEVMTPLSIISLSIENLEEDLEDLEVDEVKLKPLKSSLNEITTNYQRIEEIFENMRSLLVQKSGADTQKISIKETFFKALSLVNAKLTSKDILLKTDHFNDFEIICSTSELSQVFINLLNNSCDAVSTLETRWIEISTEVVEEQVIIKFQDSGDGIPEEVRMRIFENLFTTKGDSKGTGLGMGVCKKLVQRNNGSIRVAPEFENTTFEIKFPKA